MRVFNARTHTLTDTDRRHKKGGKFKIDCISFLFFLCTTHFSLPPSSLSPTRWFAFDSLVIIKAYSDVCASTHTHSHAQGGALSLIRDEGKKTRLLLLSALLLSSLLLLLLFLFLSLSLSLAEQSSAVLLPMHEPHGTSQYIIEWLYHGNFFFLFLSLSLSPLCERFALCLSALSLARSKELDDVTI